MPRKITLDGLIRKYNKINEEYKNLENRLKSTLKYVQKNRIKIDLEVLKHQEKMREMIDSLERYFYLNLKISDDEIYERALSYMGYEQVNKELGNIELRELKRKKNLFQIKEQLKQEKERLLKEIGIFIIKNK